MSINRRSLRLSGGDFHRIIISIVRVVESVGEYQNISVERETKLIV